MPLSRVRSVASTDIRMCRQGDGLAAGQRHFEANGRCRRSTRRVAVSAIGGVGLAFGLVRAFAKLVAQRIPAWIRNRASILLGCPKAHTRPSESRSALATSLLDRPFWSIHSRNSFAVGGYFFIGRRRAPARGVGARMLTTSLAAAKDATRVRGLTISAAPRRTRTDPRQELPATTRPIGESGLGRGI